MPQLDPSTFPTQIFWLAITFTVMCFLMVKVIVPRISQVLEERQSRISQDLEKAEQLKKEAEEAVKAYEASLAEARSKAQDAILEITQAVTARTNEAEAELGKKLAADMQAAEARIGDARDAAIANIKDMSAEIAKSAVEKLAGLEVDDAAAAKAVAGVMEGR